MTELVDYKFRSVYMMADLIDGYVRGGEGFLNYEEAYFINYSSKFSKETLLHLYIVVTLFNVYRRDYRKNGDLLGSEDLIEEWYDLFKSYSVRITKRDFNIKNTALDWFEEKQEKFELLFDKIAKEVFYLLYANRGFLLDFNNLIAETVSVTKFPMEFVTEKGTIKRQKIPEWVKTAVFHRDKGRCVFCNTDLTKIFNILSNSNYDHIVPLDLFGANDPCNIQLTCESCNKSKQNKRGSTSTLYNPWW